LWSVDVAVAQPSETDIPPTPTATPSASGNKKPAPDFSSAFARLRALGLPSVKQSNLKKLNSVQESQFSEDFPTILSTLIWEKTMPDTTTCWLFGHIFEVRSSKTPPKPDSNYKEPILLSIKDLLEINHRLSPSISYYHILQSPPVSLDFAPAPSEKEIGQQVLKEIEPYTQNPEKKPQVYLGSNLITPVCLVKSLFFACHLDERGNTALANQIAEAALTTPYGGESILNAAISLLADVAYTHAFVAYLKSKNAAEFLVALQQIEKKFPRGYSNLPAVQKVIHDLQATLSPQPHASPEVEALAKQLRSTPLPKSVIAGLNHEPEEEVDDSSEPKGNRLLWTLPTFTAAPNDPLQKCLAQGLNAFPTLLALGADTSVIPTNSLSIRNDFSRFSFSSDSSDEELALQYYQQEMPRPLTLSELVSFYLLNVITTPSKNHDSIHPAPTAILALAESWKDSLEKTDPESLAFHYLDHGSTSQKSEALPFLMTSTDPLQLAKLEQHLLDLRPRWVGYGLIQRYLSERGKEGAAFLERYASLIRNEFKEATKDYTREEWQLSDQESAKAPENKLHTLAAMVTDSDAGTLLEAFAKNSDQEREALPALEKALSRLKREEALFLILKTAVHINDPKSQMRFLQLPFRIFRSNQPLSIPLTEPMCPLWIELLNNSTVTAGPDAGLGLTNGEIASLYFLSLHAGLNFNIQPWVPYLGTKAVFKRCLEQAKAMANHQPLPGLPDASKVSAERLKSIRTQLDQLPPSGLPTAIEALNLDEILALAQSLETTPSLAINRASYWIQKIEIHDSVKSLFPNALEWKGKPLTQDLIDSLLARLKQTSPLAVQATITGSLSGQGITLSLSPMPQSRNSVPPGMKDPAVHAILILSQKQPSENQAVFLSENDLQQMSKTYKGAIASWKKQNDLFQAQLKKAITPNDKTLFGSVLTFKTLLPQEPSSKEPSDQESSP